MPAKPPTDARSGPAPAGDDAERRERAFLVFDDAGAREQVVFLEPATAPVWVGRAPPAEILLDWDSEVSRRHARFEQTGEEWMLIDEGFSRNGTFVNRERLEGSHRLSDRDVLRFGATQVTFRAPVAMTPAPAPAPVPAPDPEAAANLALSSTQRRVLVALCRPYRGAGVASITASDERIADELVISVTEVKTHLRVLCAKLGVDPAREGARRQLADRALALGLMSERER